VIPVFIGYDRREKLAADVLAHSIKNRSSLPVSITEIRLDQLPEFNREWHPKQSTEFSFSRFLVPYLCGYQGHAIFMDCDMLCLDDIARLWALRDEAKALQVVKHDYQPLEGRKFLNQPQTPYAKKNWSSVMLFNNARCQALTPEYVNTASGLDLHQFKWTDERLIGELPENWNCLVRSIPASSR
jgi:lipopolysaccharide biosynthesis glycosyltransferase